jgi:hypothetical protein
MIVMRDSVLNFYIGETVYTNSDNKPHIIKHFKTEICGEYIFCEVIFENEKESGVITYNPIKGWYSNISKNK